VFGEQATTSGSGASATPSAMPAPPAAMRSFTLPAPLLQRVKAADGQAVSLPQTATPAERMAIVGGAYVLLSLALLLLVLRRSKKAGRLG